MAGITARRVVVALDCPGARELAEFYASMLGWRIRDNVEYSDWVDVLPPEGELGTVALECQTVSVWRAPTWPEGPVPTQVHLDFYVDSIADSGRPSSPPAPAGTSNSPAPTGGLWCTSTRWGIRSACARSDGAGRGARSGWVASRP
ncbi:MAG: VOC family protein [Dietzia sp.]|uniref:VOC family protein n=2 Tax=Dietziaceae TaxID=85029 RepID=UPI0019D600E1|nr:MULTISPECIES: VOC family protein [Dietzia]MDO8393456.1 VOC family protein [Dietzia sp.]